MDFEGKCLAEEFGMLENRKEEQKRTVEQVTLEIQTLHKQAEQMVLGYAIEIGRRLVEVKAMLPHGAWGDYLKNKVNYSRSTANNFMLIFNKYGADQQSLFGPVAKSQTLGNLTYTKALLLLAIPEEEREDFIEQNRVDDLSSRELKKLIQEREAAEEALQAEQQERKELELKFQREKEEQDSAIKCLNSQITAAETLAQKAKMDQQKAEQQRDTARDEVKRLKQQLKELENRPIEVAVQEPDPEMMEQIRQEAVQEVKNKIKQAEEAQRHAEERVKQLEEQLASSSNPAVVAFKIHFETVQKEFFAMVDCLKQMDNNTETKMKKAFFALLEEMKKCEF